MLQYFVLKAYICSLLILYGIGMSDKVSIKLPQRFRERYEAFAAHFGYRSFNNFCDHAVQEILTNHERTYDIALMEKEKVKRMERED